MKRASKLAFVAACASAALLTAGAANASLHVFQQYTGNLGISTAGFGSVSDAGTITANVPAGSTVVAAYLYSSLYFVNPGTPAAGTLNGNVLNYTPLGNTGNCCSLEASRADVTSIVAPIINGGAGGAYNFNLTETSANTDGEALVVVYSNATLGTSTIGILDGFSDQNGDNSAITFASGLHPSDPGFHAEMRIGDGFSYDQGGVTDQVSLVDVNGQRLSNVTGNCDDNVDSFCQDGNLITMGGDNDPFTIAAPGTPANDINTDHERYDLSPFIADGATAIHIHTINPSIDDNIFLEVFDVSGLGVVTHGVPEPATWAMMLLGFFGLGSMIRRKSAVTA
jgi:hypothetical protein